MKTLEQAQATGIHIFHTGLDDEGNRIYWVSRGYAKSRDGEDRGELVTFTGSSFFCTCRSGRGGKLCMHSLVIADRLLDEARCVYELVQQCQPHTKRHTKQRASA